MNYIKLLILTLLLGCGGRVVTKKPTPTIPQDITVHLPQVDQQHTDCLVRYKSKLYDTNAPITLALKIVNVYEGTISSRLSEKVEYNSQLIDTLNSYYGEAGIKFISEIKETMYSGELIEDFTNHYKGYREVDVITLIIYHTPKKYYNGIANAAPGDVTGVHVSKVLTSTLAHELGHLLGLLHTFESDVSNGLTVNTGDGICDTPAHNLMDFSVDSRCEFKGVGAYTEEELKILIPNYMSYNRDCRDNFTPIQVLAMRWYIENYPLLTAAMR